MKPLSLGLTLVVAVLFLNSCAKQSSPMGGPQDEDPPILLSSSPKNESINVKPEVISLEFNEYVQLENPNQTVIITPKLETSEIEYLAIKNGITITLNQDLEDSTTYLFNFQNSIQDITENNPAERLKLVFSTGPTIDSLTVSGTVDFIHPYDKPDFEDVIIGLYQNSDTTDLFTSAPYYITQADSAGNFKITNIKEGTFRAYAWYDENNSLKAEFRNEAYGYLKEPLEVTQNISNLHINLARADLSPLKINRSASTGSNFDIVLSKPPAEFEINHAYKNEELFYRLEDNTIRIYHRNLTNDSTEIQLQIWDSVGVQLDTLLMAVFQESERSKEDLEITTNSNLNFIDEINAELTFNKPLYSIAYDSLYFSYDSASIIPITPDMVSFPDSSHLRTKLKIIAQIPDSIPQSKFTLYASDSTFQDTEEIWNTQEIKTTFTRLKSDNLADGIYGNINTSKKPILVQLLSNQNKVIKEQYLTDTTYFEFTELEASTYKIQAIVDTNSNRRWDPGNYIQNIQPELIFYYIDEETGNDELILRGGWTLEDQNIQPRRSSGFETNNNAGKDYDFIKIPLEMIKITNEDLTN
ncbi:Ig-like domain-containing domain [Cyclobacterium salsum]|uniref:Ig-like domain-containing domain n=1 Tax=Cyclobacterium salsum TaxID=2666329 RepID=UPI0013911E4C|nr:Ig-like domain-containing domain [Cyclobacterium salsum]